MLKSRPDHYGSVAVSIHWLSTTGHAGYWLPGCQRDAPPSKPPCSPTPRSRRPTPAASRLAATGPGRATSDSDASHLCRRRAKAGTQRPCRTPAGFPPEAVLGPPEDPTRGGNERWMGWVKRPQRGSLLTRGAQFCLQRQVPISAPGRVIAARRNSQRCDRPRRQCRVVLPSPLRGWHRPSPEAPAAGRCPPTAGHALRRERRWPARGLVRRAARGCLRLPDRSIWRW
jgi:hypothetical protein